MKTKKLSRKLTFSKQTIANLAAREQNVVRGGTIPTNTCGTCTLGMTCRKTCETCTGCHSGLPSCGPTADSIHICVC